MVGKWFKATMLAVLLATVMVGVVHAEEEVHPPRIRVVGEVTDVDLENASFGFHTRSGKDLRFYVNDRTSFRSETGTIESLEDLEPRMYALIVASEAGNDGLLALLVAVGEPSDRPTIFRVNGLIQSVSLDQSSFSIEGPDGEQTRFSVTDRTEFKSRDGSVSSLSDLEPGMAAMVAGLESEAGSPLALLVVVGQSHDQQERFEVAGEITNVIPGLNIFELHTRNGADLRISVVERTIFRSPSGLVEDIHDLKAGMKALVFGIKKEDGSLIALGVGVAQVDDRPDRESVDLKAAGEIIAIGDRSFTLRTFHQGELTFTVDGSTKYKSRGDGGESFDDLQIGMYAAVGAKELGSGELKALIVGIGQPGNDRAQERPRRPTEGSDQVRPERDSGESSDPMSF